MPIGGRGGKRERKKAQSEMNRPTGFSYLKGTQKRRWGKKGETNKKT